MISKSQVAELRKQFIEHDVEENCLACENVPDLLDTIEALYKENALLSDSLHNAKAYRIKLDRVAEAAKAYLDEEWDGNEPYKKLENVAEALAALGEGEKK